MLNNFWKLMAPLMVIVLLAAGCQETKEEEAHNKMDDDTLNGNAMDGYNDEPEDGQVGYVRFNKNQLNQDNEKNREIKVNREQMADMISRMILRYDNFDDVATVVTDNEVLVAYKKAGDMEREQAAEMVQKTAYSLVPSFYHVYVSDNPASFGDVQSLGNSTVYDQGYNDTIDSIIKKMKESPQGRNRNTKEDTGMEN
ncbi:Sporulation lipoprotein YhcN/YlaJ (Spore_YhcN_YlaJ) [Halobacillus dabanensis]|uniref:Sporulation lipoprotein YhcN/YlaJ (Spore_YhcN_YlaJ) n=1 Tax=Halobacillus dabanensis TaxID=240302 RepID=A0A1I3R2P8_HALDA|nr:Sporulation lipoprotein YhcN/YlaJ (Spore_YhcN_YlaJ) [Halobacillus dabanensis]